MAVDSWGETHIQEENPTRAEKREVKRDPRWFQRSLAGDHTLHPSGAAERRTV